MSLRPDIKVTSGTPAVVNASASADAGPNPLLQFTETHVTPQCKIIIYPWVLLDEPDSGAAAEVTSAEDLSKTTPLDISAQVMNCSFSKNIGSPAGAFSFTLANSPKSVSGEPVGDWTDVIKRGSWCVIYMSQHGELEINPDVGPPLPSSQGRESTKIRCVGFIDRVATKSGLDDQGRIGVTYEVNGRDFGVIYSDTTIWHNFFRFEKILTDTIATSDLNVLGTVEISRALEIVHDLFFYPLFIPGAQVNDQKSLVEIGLQWILPRQLIRDVGLDRIRTPAAPFWGAILGIKDFSPTVATLSIEKPADFLTGNAWDALKRISVPQFHELFTETTRAGVPTLFFRPIPFGIDKGGYKSVGRFVTLYKDLSAIKIPATDLISFDLGEDNHNRYNSFLTTVSTSLISRADNINILEGEDFPRNLPDSIKRFGFKPMHATIDSLVKNDAKDNGIPHDELVLEYNKVLVDYWQFNHLSETGSAAVIGNNEIKIGIALTFGEGAPHVFGKRYYIEGYVDNFTVGSNGEKSWEASVFLTHGFLEADLKSKFIRDDRKTATTVRGDFTPSGRLV